MAAKLLHSLTDENPDLQKQIGCMTGIFQLFDRQHILIGGSRRLVGHTPKRLPQGNSHFHSLDRELNNTYLRSGSREKYSTPPRHTQERQRISTESSRASFSSSSHSSSFSSLDCNRAPPLDPTSYDRITFPDTPSPHFSRQSLDIRDFVKDSMYREIHSLSLKPKASDEEITVTRRRDSARPQHKTSADPKESLKALAKLQEPPWYQNEPRELLRSASYHAKEGSSLLDSRDAPPRFSYDGRDVNRAPLDFSKSALKLRDAPRLSLDGRESLRESKSSVFLKSLQKDGSSIEFDNKIQNSQQAGGNQTRPPSVVARLMGLEALPDSVSSSNDSNPVFAQRFRGDDFLNIPRLSAKTGRKSIQTLGSSRKEPRSPRWMHPDSSMKPISRFPIEPAPWKQIDGTKSSQKSAARAVKAPPMASTAFPSVYSEIEKRLEHLEFTQSGKDLRALKQILEAMQSKGFLETEKEARGPNEPKYSNSIQESRSMSNSQKQRASSMQRHYESPIVIMKPAKLVEKSGIPASSVIPLDSLPDLTKPTSQQVSTEFVDNGKGLNSGRKSGQQVNAVNSVNMRNDRTLKNTHISLRVSQLAKDGNVGPGKSTGSISPRMQQKKIELDKRSLPPAPDSSKSRRQPNKQQGESSSPGGRRRPKLPGLQQSVDQSSEANVDSRKCENEPLLQSNESMMQSSRNALVGSSERSPIGSGCESLSVNASKFGLSDLVDKKSLSKAESADFGFVPTEYSSPVSVLDKVVCKDDSPSPVKYVGKTLQVDVPTEKNIDPSTVLENGQENPADSFPPADLRQTPSQINHKKLQNIETLVQKLRRLNSTHDEARTDYIASLCDQTTNPDRRYISEILLASGLLLWELGSSLANFQFHPSGHPINPELFLVLEQTKTSALSGGRSHRKLVFDAVNEILARELAGRAGSTGLSAQRLLTDLCLEIERLGSRSVRCGSREEEEEEEGWKEFLREDVMGESRGWRDFEVEVSAAVLDIERSIFKDLVNELVIGESNGLRTKPSWRRLFGK